MNDKSTHTLTSADASDSKDIVRRVSADALRTGGEAEQLIEAIRNMLGGASEDKGQGLAYSALLSVLGAELVKFVRDDEGTLWPFVPSEESYWRGPLRLTEDQQVQEARFYPEQEKIEWVSPWDKPSGLTPGGRVLTISPQE